MFDRVSGPAARWTHGLIHKLLQATVGCSWAAGGQVCSEAQECTVRTSGGVLQSGESSTVHETFSIGVSKYWRAPQRSQSCH